MHQCCFFLWFDSNDCPTSISWSKFFRRPFQFTIRPEFKWSPTQICPQKLDYYGRNSYIRHKCNLFFYNCVLFRRKLVVFVAGHWEWSWSWPQQEVVGTENSSEWDGGEENFLGFFAGMEPCCSKFPEKLKSSGDGLFFSGGVKSPRGYFLK